MPRARMVHPETMTDSTLGELPRDVRLFFIYVLTHADDAGNFLDDPRELKAVLFPYDDDIDPPKIREFIALLRERTRYVPYTLQGRTWNHIKNFHKWQRIEKPAAPKHPLFPGQKYTYMFRESGKWVKRTVSEKEWNTEKHGEQTALWITAYPERTGNVPPKGRKEGSNSFPFPTLPHPASEQAPDRTADPAPRGASSGPAGAAASKRTKPNGQETPIDFDQPEHLEILNKAQELGADISSAKTIEPLKAYIQLAEKRAALQSTT